MQAVALTMIIALIVAPFRLDGAVLEYPTRIVSLHYPCLALRAKIQGTIRVHCAIGPDGACSDVKIIFGHPLFYKDVVDNAKQWRFRRSNTASRTADIDYRFEVRGVRVPEDQADVEVTFELPNRVLVTAPFDAKVPCRMPPIE